MMLKLLGSIAGSALFGPVPTSTVCQPNKAPPPFPGSRTLAPGQLDPYTIERCAEVAQYGGCTSSGCDVRYGENAASWHSDLCPSGIATRIRALARKEGE